MGKIEQPMSDAERQRKERRIVELGTMAIQARQNGDDRVARKFEGDAAKMQSELTVDDARRRHHGKPNR